MTPLQAAMELVRLGVLIVNSDGAIWKVKEVRNTGALVSIEPRRAEGRRANGYLCVMVNLKGKVYNVLAHRLVWTAMVGPIPARMDLNHLDGNKEHNDPVNLEVATRSENHLHAYRTGLKARTDFAADYSMEAKRLRNEGLPYSAIGARLGISQTTAFRAVRA